MVLEVNAPIVDYEGSRKHLLDRALLVEPMRRWRDGSGRAALIVTPSAAIVPRMCRERISSRMGRRYGAISAWRGPGRLARRASRRRSLAVFPGAFRILAWRDPSGRGDAAPARAGSHIVRAVLIGDGPERERSAAERRPIERAESCSLARPSRGDARAWPRRISASRHSTPPLIAAGTRFFVWSPVKIFEYMSAGLPVVAPAFRGSDGLSRTGGRDCCMTPPIPAPLRGRWQRSPMTTRCGPRWAPQHASGR